MSAGQRGSATVLGVGVVATLLLLAGLLLVVGAAVDAAARARTAADLAALAGAGRLGSGVDQVGACAAAATTTARNGGVLERCRLVAGGPGGAPVVEVVVSVQVPIPDVGPARARARAGHAAATP